LSHTKHITDLREGDCTTRKERKGPTETCRIRTDLREKIDDICRATRETRADTVDRPLLYALSHALLKDAVCKDLTFDTDP
jgi:hypothetical protein